MYQMFSPEQVLKTTQRWFTLNSFSAGPQDVPIFGPLDSSAIYIHLLHLLPTSQISQHNCPHQKYFTVRPGTPNSGCTSTGETSAALKKRRRNGQFPSWAVQFSASKQNQIYNIKDLEIFGVHIVVSLSLLWATSRGDKVIVLVLVMII